MNFLSQHIRGIIVKLFVRYKKESVETRYAQLFYFIIDIFNLDQTNCIIIFILKIAFK